MLVRLKRIIIVWNISKITRNSYRNMVTLILWKYRKWWRKDLRLRHLYSTKKIFVLSLVMNSTKGRWRTNIGWFQLLADHPIMKQYSTNCASLNFRYRFQSKYWIVMAFNQANRLFKENIDLLINIKERVKNTVWIK